MKKISVIVTNWNGLNLLKKYLEKVIINSPEAFEIILADDASEDDSIVFATSLQKKYSKLKIIAHKKNQGFGRNTNDAVKKAHGDYVVLLNSDSSVRGFKGDKRPIVPQEQRAKMLAALSLVDYVVIFDEDEPLRLVEIIKPQ